MAMRGLGLGELGVLLLAGAFAGIRCGAQDVSVDRLALLDGVVEIAVPGIPGPVCLFGPGAFCVVPCDTDGGQGAVVAAGTAGQARVVAFGHNGYLQGRMLAYRDTGRLVTNAARWSGRSSAPAITVIDAPDLAAHLAEQGLAVTPATVAEASAQPVATAVVCVDAHRVDDALQTRLREHLGAGGGLLIFATGWGWVQLNPGRLLTRDFAGSTLLAPAGLAFSAAMTRKPTEGGFDAAAVASPYVHAAAALDALLEQADGQRALSTAEQKQTAATVTMAAEAVPLDDAVFRPRLDALAAPEGGVAAPTRAAPVRETDGLRRLQVALETRRLGQTPAEAVVAHPAAAAFPGAVPEGAPRVTRELVIDTAIPRWHSTGLYAAPGERVFVTVPEAAAGKGLSVRIGVHSDGVWKRPEWWRHPEITRRFALGQERTAAACAFGGLVLIEVPANSALGSVAVTIEGGVSAPWFVRGRTSLAEWRQTIRQHPAPWAEIGSDKVILSVPAEYVRELDDPEDLTAFWDSVLDACADLATRDRRRSSPERYVTDLQISVGYMHAGYPIMTFLDAAPRFVDTANLRRRGDWGMFHEMGHNHQSPDWTFGGAGEVTVNLFTLYILETCCTDAPVFNGVKPENIAKRIQRHLVDNRADFAAWKEDPFTGLIMYIQLQRAFGWDAFKRVFAEYRDLPAADRPKSDDEKRDQWLTRFSRTVGRDLGPFFAVWGIPVSAAARESLRDLPEWMPEGFPPAG